MVQEPWYKIYRHIAERLYERYLNDPIDIGEVLYQEFSKRDTGFLVNSWINNLSYDWGVKSLDPIQIFASLTGSKMTIANKERRILFLLDLLTVPESQNPYPSVSIDFTGCPMPPPIRLQASRSKETQTEIWETFAKVMAHSNKAITDIEWERVHSWYGVGVRSMTIFFFWIDSAHFLPLDKNTQSFLTTYKRLPGNWLKKDGYLQIIQEIEGFDKEPQRSIEPLFREIARVAYSQNVLDEKKIALSDNLWAFIDLDRLASHDGVETTGKEDVGSHDNDEQKRVLVSSNYFKLIAIETLPDCDEIHRKRLEEETVFGFNHAFEFSIGRITHFPNREVNLFSHPSNDIKISVSAVVGKNGTGKSTLVEFLLRIVNNITFKFQKLLGRNKFKCLQGLHGAVYFQTQNLQEIVKVSVVDEDVQVVTYKKEDSESYFDLHSPSNSEAFDYDKHFGEFFYSVVVNYSLYSFNASHKNSGWIDSIMRKNDGYQAPAVIAPMRTDGNIDVNLEESFAVIRLMANLFEPVEVPEDSILQLTDDKLAYKVQFDLHQKALAGRKPKPNYQVAFEKIKDDVVKRGRILIAVRLAFNFDQSVTQRDPIMSPVEEAENYILRKLMKIAAVVNEYIVGEYFDISANMLFDNKLEAYLAELVSDTSHHTTKLKQTINYLRFPALLPEGRSFPLQIGEFAAKLQDFLGNQRLPNEDVASIPIEELLPPPIFSATILLKDKKQKEHDFERLSSGEKQRIHVVSTILYHLRNLDSVLESKRIAYKFINLILDEIELYYHPDYQRTFLDYLLRMISRLPMENILGINLIFATHSPYILSDIPHNYVLRLNDGKPEIASSMTFGANIHELLRDSFFMEHGVMGEFAKVHILGLIRWLRGKVDSRDPNANSDEPDGVEFLWDQAKARNVIDAIGEPMIRQDLNELYFTVFPESLDELDREIERLQNLRAGIKEITESKNKNGKP